MDQIENAKNTSLVIGTWIKRSRRSFRIMDIIREGECLILADEDGKQVRVTADGISTVWRGVENLTQWQKQEGLAELPYPIVGVKDKKLIFSWILPNADEKVMQEFVNWKQLAEEEDNILFPEMLIKDNTVWGFPYILPSHEDFPENGGNEPIPMPLVPENSPAGEDETKTLVSVIRARFDNVELTQVDGYPYITVTTSDTSEEGYQKTLKVVMKAVELIKPKVDFKPEEGYPVRGFLCLSTATGQWILDRIESPEEFTISAPESHDLLEFFFAEDTHFGNLWKNNEEFKRVVKQPGGIKSLKEAIDWIIQFPEMNQYLGMDMDVGTKIPEECTPKMTHPELFRVIGKILAQEFK